MVLGLQPLRMTLTRPPVSTLGPRAAPPSRGSPSNPQSGSKQQSCHSLPARSRRASTLPMLRVVGAFANVSHTPCAPSGLVAMRFALRTDSQATPCGRCFDLFEVPRFRKTSVLRRPTLPDGDVAKVIIP